MRHRHASGSPFFLFATGIENSAPTIKQGAFRVDEMDRCHHYTRWREDFELVRELGIRFLRYGVPLHRAYPAADRFDWTFADQAFGALREMAIVPIVDLCHFGVPDWLGNFQNPEFPELFARYARAFAVRYPWVQLYTPVNEMYICALFSARYGWWNEQLSSDRAFVTALKHIVKGNVLAMHAILDLRPDAIFVQSESSEYFHAESPRAIRPAEILNAQRFLSLDLNYGRRIESEMYEYLMDNGMTRDEYHFFVDHSLKHHCIMGNDYYCTNEHRVAADGQTQAAGEIFGYAEITWQYYDRYRLPVMHTETNFAEGPTGCESVNWLWKEWANVLRVRNDGIPVVGFTWYSLTDQVDWDTALREDNGRVNPLGLFDLDRRIRPAGTAYKQLITDWHVLLAAIGLYGVVAFGVVRRTREIAIQLALGASPGAVRWQVVRGALALAAAGLVAGLLGAVWLGRLMEGLLFEVTPTDPVTLGAVAAILLSVTIIAAAVPAARATRIDPLQALRET